MRVRGLQQQWWRVDPVVIKESAPQKWKGRSQLHSPTHMDRPSGLYSDSERSQWATLQAVPVYQEMILNRIELGSCQAVSQCPSAMMKGDGSGFNLGLLEKEVPGYAWYKALTNPGNWISVGALVLAMISLWCRVSCICGQEDAVERQNSKLQWESPSLMCRTPPPSVCMCERQYRW